MKKNSLLILAVFVVASCGLAYELIAAAMTSYLLGDSIFQFSSIIGCYLFAMGLGSYLSRYVNDQKIYSVFIDIEILVGIFGGFSALVLFACFGYALSFKPVLYGLVMVIGILVGAEIPLVMRILNEQKASFKDLVSRVLTFDYLGALAVSLLFPLILAPRLGLARSALLFGLLNVAIAVVSIYYFKNHLNKPRGLLIKAIMATVALVFAFTQAESWIRLSEKKIYGDDIIYAKTTPYQRLVITSWKNDLRLYINGNLQFSSRDEYRYHEALVHPVLSALPQPQRVLVLGGGDGLAVREILKYPSVKHIQLVDLDPAMTQLFSKNPQLTQINQHSLTNPKVTVTNADAAKWLEQNQEVFDAIIIDFPDPSNFGLGKLYSVPMYRLVAKHLSQNGLVVIQSTSPFYAPKSFWCVNQTLKQAGFYTTPYHTLVPSFGEWGYIIGSFNNHYQPPQQYQIPVKFIDGPQTQQMFYFAKDMQVPKVEANHLNNQQLVTYFEEDWGKVIR